MHHHRLYRVSNTTNSMVKVTSGPKPPAHSPTSTMVCTSSQHATSIKEDVNSEMKLNRGRFLRRNRTETTKVTAATKYPRDAFSPDMAHARCPLLCFEENEISEGLNLPLYSLFDNVAHAQTQFLSETRQGFYPTTTCQNTQGLFQGKVTKLAFIQ